MGTDVSPQAMSLARITDRLDDGSYIVHLSKVSGGQWEIQITSVDPVGQKWVLVPRAARVKEPRISRP